MTKSPIVGAKVGPPPVVRVVSKFRGRDAPRRMVSERTRAAREALSRSWKIDAALVGLMVLLAVVGMGLTQASESGAWEYWLVALSVYMVVGVTRVTLRAWRDEAPMLPRVLGALAHWFAPLFIMGALLYLEGLEAISRDAASVSALLLLALSCLTAGIHLDVLFLPLGLVLTAMAVALMVLQESLVLLWVAVLLVAVLAVAVFYFGGRARATYAAGLD